MKLSSTKVFGDFRRNPETMQYEKFGEQELTLTLEDSTHLVFTEKKSDGMREKKVTVKESIYDSIYSIKKNFIRAQGGADGLFGFLSDPDCLGLYLSFFNNVFDYMN